MNSDVMVDHDADIDFCDSNVGHRSDSEQQSPTVVAGKDHDPTPPSGDGEHDDDTSVATPGGRNVRAKLSHPSSPRSCARDIGVTEEPIVEAKPQTEGPGPGKVRVIVRDVAYTTYRAVLYYVS